MPSWSGSPVVLLAQASIAPSAASVANGVDISNQMTGLTIIATGDVLTVPPTGTADESVALGALHWSIMIGWLADDADSNNLARMFYTALKAQANGGTLYFEGKARNAAIGSTNPRWFGTFLVSGLSFGGQQKKLLQDQQTFRLTAAASYLFT